MVTLAQRIEELRTARGLSRPALAAALGFPRTAIEKFETGRQTPTQDQQNKLASYFGVSLFYLRGETNDTTQMSDWMDGAFLDEPAPVPAPRRAAVKPAVAASSGGEGGTMFDAFLTSKKFQEALRTAVLDTLRTPEGQELLTKAIRKELANRQMLRAGSLALAAFHAVRRPASGRGVRCIDGVSVRAVPGRLFAQVQQLAAVHPLQHRRTAKQR